MQTISDVKHVTVVIVAAPYMLKYNNQHLVTQCTVNDKFLHAINGNVDDDLTKGKVISKM